MPPKNKRQAQIASVWAKRKCQTSVPSQSFEELESDEESYTPELPSPSDLVDEHVQNWVSTLSRDDLMSISLFLHQILVNKHGVLMTPASESIGKALNNS